jgi:hypothetical protein
LIVLPVSSVTIPGTATDEDGTISSYEWIKRSGPACTVVNNNGPSLNLTGLVSGPYIFRLVVTDNTGLTDFDDVLLNVTLPPVSDAGPDRTVDLPVASIMLKGSGSDPDGTIKFVVWSRVSGPAVTLVDTDDPTLILTDLREGTYTFMLKVTDNLLVQTCDYVTVTVNNPMLLKGGTTAKSVIVEPAGDSGRAGSEVDLSISLLGPRTASDLENCLVAIFNATGARIFSGRWTRETYREVFTQDGFYIYNVIREGKRVEAGKIYVKN